MLTVLSSPQLWSSLSRRQVCSHFLVPLRTRTQTLAAARRLAPQAHPEEGHQNPPHETHKYVHPQNPCHADLCFEPSISFSCLYRIGSFHLDESTGLHVRGAPSCDAIPAFMGSHSGQDTAG